MGNFVLNRGSAVMPVNFHCLRVPVGNGIFLYPFIRDIVTKKVGHLLR